ncbi:sodium:calcium antiporter [Candidatus Micrarchaeota archaeon]|nr:sodium:calcium antiporter [Candidatus Micrarchaeota archaeon]
MAFIFYAVDAYFLAMLIFEQFVFLVIGLVVLTKSAEIVIDKGAALAKFLRVSELAIGFLLVSIATTIPELVVSLIAASEGHTGLVVGNVLGSNITNLSLILGLAATVGVVTSKKFQVRPLLPVLAALVVIPLVLTAVDFGRLAGLLLLAAYGVFAYVALQKKITYEDGPVVSSQSVIRDASLLVLAGVALAIGAKLTVDSSVFIAEGLGLSKVFIGATVVAIGTSLPELAVAFQAMRNGHSGIALGNLVGASITNLTLTLGLATLINPISANLVVVLDLVIFSVVVSGVLWFFLENGKLGKNQGTALVGLFLLYLASLLTVELGL